MEAMTASATSSYVQALSKLHWSANHGDDAVFSSKECAILLSVLGDKALTIGTRDKIEGQIDIDQAITDRQEE